MVFLLLLASFFPQLGRLVRSRSSFFLLDTLLLFAHRTDVDFHCLPRAGAVPRQHAQVASATKVFLLTLHFLHWHIVFSTSSFHDFALTSQTSQWHTRSCSASGNEKRSCVLGVGQYLAAAILPPRGRLTRTHNERRSLRETKTTKNRWRQGKRGSTIT